MSYVSCLMFQNLADLRIQMFLILEEYVLEYTDCHLLPFHCCIQRQIARNSKVSPTDST
jgi:hypothetical protein